MAHYGTLVGGDAYFATKLYVEAWDEVTDDQRTRALTEMTRRIDRLRFRGTKADSDQDLEWPRTDPKEVYSLTEIPVNVEYATYEGAYALLDGVNPDQEYENLSASADGYSSVRTTYNRATVPEHFAAGIPSFLAWQYLKPLLGNVKGVRLCRVS